MKLLALLIGILAERYLARWSHLREFRRLDEQANRLAERLMRLDKRTAPYIVAGITLVFAAPIGVVAWLLRDQWQQIPWFVFAVLVLLFSFGPRDLKAEALAYHDKADAGDDDGARAQAEAIIGASPPDKPQEQAAAVEKATYLKANNRIFGVIFWFLVAGPVGPAFAFGFRVLNSLRRYTATLPGGEELHRAAVLLHGIIAWVPARITSASFALAGNFDDAINAWRGIPAEEQSNLFDGTGAVLGAVGAQALGDRPDRVRGAVALVERSLIFVWGPIGRSHDPRLGLLVRLTESVDRWRRWVHRAVTLRQFCPGRQFRRRHHPTPGAAPYPQRRPYLRLGQSNLGGRCGTRRGAGRGGRASAGRSPRPGARRLVALK